VCCFSVARAPFSLLGWLFAPRVHVSKTSIFARRLPNGRQALVYSMHLRTAREVAMILPIPTATAAEDALELVDLSGHASFFSDLESLFVVAQTAAPRKGGFGPRLASRPRLVVHRVGSFEASFVPTRGDFDRLDPRFRMPEVLFDSLPEYAAYGFAVFQLAAQSAAIHPMALTFQPREEGSLFFPTVHVHDGTLREIARFDHALYWQSDAAETAPIDERSLMNPLRDVKGLLDPSKPVIRRRLSGKLPNRDTRVSLA